METLYMGVDFHPYKQTIAYVSSETGELRIRHFDHADKKALRSFYRQAGKGAVVGIEATGSTQWFEKMLASTGVQLRIGNPRLIRRMALSYHQSDTRDAETILDLLMSDSFPEVEPRSEESRLVLHLLRHRHSLVRQRTANSNAMQSFARGKGLKRFSIRAKTAGKKLLAAVENEDEEFVVRSRLRACETLSEEIGETEERLEKYFAENEKAILVGSFPGVGMLTSLCLVHTLGDVNRFRRMSQIASFAGLDPLNKSSGERRRIGNISKRGSRLLRFLLGQSAQASRDRHIREVYRRVSRRRGRPIAKVAAARKLLIGCSIMLRDGIDYQEYCRRGDVGLCELTINGA